MTGKGMTQIYVSAVLRVDPKLEAEDEKFFYGKLVEEKNKETKRTAWTIPSE